MSHGFLHTASFTWISGDSFMVLIWIISSIAEDLGQLTESISSTLVIIALLCSVLCTLWSRVTEGGCSQTKSSRFNTTVQRTMWSCPNVGVGVGATSIIKKRNSSNEKINVQHTGGKYANDTPDGKFFNAGNLAFCTLTFFLGLKASSQEETTRD